GDHTKLTVVKARSGEHRWILDVETTAIIRDLARLLPDAHIASVLNRAGKRTGRDNTSQSRGFAPSAMIMTFPFIALANVPSVANCRSSKPLKLGHQEGASRGGFAPWFFPDTP